MKNAFYVYQVNAVIKAWPNLHFEIHGRTYVHLKVGQELYINESEQPNATIENIITYGVEMDEIVPMMGCCIVVYLKHEIGKIESVYTKESGVTGSE